MTGQAEIPPFAQAAAGAAGSIVSNTIVYPLDLISTRVQTSGSKAQAKSPLAAISEVVKKKGISGLYQGLGTDNLSNTLSNFLFFFFRAAIVERIHARSASSASSAATASNSSSSSSSSSKRKGPPPLTPGEDLAAGALAGVFSRALTTPLSNVTVRKQTHSSSSKGGAKGKGKEKGKGKGKDGDVMEDDSSSDEETTFEDEPSIMDVINEILNDKGIAGLWSGFETAILLSTTPALTFYLTNIYTRLLFSSRRPSSSSSSGSSKGGEPIQTPLQIFLSSALGNATSTSLLYPLILAKTLLQYRSPRTGRRTYRNLGDVLIKVGRGKKGVAGLYQGLESQLIKGVISHGVTMLVKSRVELGFVWLYLWMKGRK